MPGSPAGDVPGRRDGAPGAAARSSPAWEFRPIPVLLVSSSEEEAEAEAEEVAAWAARSRDSDLPNGQSQPSYNFCGFKKSFLCKDPVSARLPQRFLDTKTHIPSSWKQPLTSRLQPLTAEEAERNAEELVAEEERVKKKAEKKKLKKKRQKERRRQKKLLGSREEAAAGSSSRDGAAGSDGSDGSSAEGPEGCAGSGPSPCPTEGPGGPEEPAGVGGAEEVPEDDLDLSCTFVSKARQKAGVKLPSPTKEKPASTEDALPGTRPRHKAPEPLDASALERSLVLADLGNEAAQKGLYAAAVQAFTDAMQLNPREHRLFGNRSYCYEKLERYEEALQDAQASLRLQPGWPKGLFRKGKALRGLKRYAEAARAFQELLHRDGSRADAAAQLEQCRALLQESSESRPAGVPPPSPLGAAGPAQPLPGQRPNGSGVDRNGLVANPGSKSPSKGQVQAAADKTQTLPPQHPARGCYPLWVGNVSAGVTKQALQSSFSRFGQIRFIRVLPGRRCAFVNFVQKEAAEAAYRTMLDADVQGTRLALQLKHPCHATPPPGGHKPSVK